MKYIKLFESMREVPKTYIDVSDKVEQMTTDIMDYLSELLEPFSIEITEGRNCNFSIDIGDNDIRYVIKTNGYYYTSYYNNDDNKELNLDNFIDYLFDNYSSYMCEDKIFINAIEKDPNNFKYYKDIFDDPYGVLSKEIKFKYAYLKNELF